MLLYRDWCALTKAGGYRVTPLRTGTHRVTRRIRLIRGCDSHRLGSRLEEEDDPLETHTGTQKRYFQLVVSLLPPLRLFIGSAER